MANQDKGKTHWGIRSYHPKLLPIPSRGMRFIHGLVGLLPCNTKSVCPEEWRGDPGGDEPGWDEARISKSRWMPCSPPAQRSGEESGETHCLTSLPSHHRLLIQDPNYRESCREVGWAPQQRDPEAGAGGTYTNKGTLPTQNSGHG